MIKIDLGNLQQYRSWLNEQYVILRTKAKPLLEYWKRLTEREQYMIFCGGIIIVLTIIWLIIDSGLIYLGKLQKNNYALNNYIVDAQMMRSEYNALNNISTSNFSSITVDKVKDDVTQVLGIKNPDVILADGTLSIRAANVKFDDVMLLLDELTKSYGLFPDALTITRLSQSGYVSFHVSFKHVQT